MNGKIIKCIRRVCRYAREHGVKTIVQYGDVGDRTVLSYPAQVALYQFMLGPLAREFDWHFVLGNHDMAENGINSLQVLDVVAKTTRHIKVYANALELVKLEGRRFNMMPHPFTDFRRDALNVAHLELKNSFRDNGRRVDHGLHTKHAAVIGHLHTCHQVRRAHFSGTLYQTNFGESLPKSFHHVHYEDDDPYSIEVTNVPFEPPWKLLNLQIATESDLEQIEDNPDVLYKLFIKEGLDLDLPDVMNEHPNVVRTNKFKNKQELKQMIEEEWDFSEGVFDNRDDTREALTTHFQTKAKLSRSEIKRAFRKLDEIQNQARKTKPKGTS